MEKRILVLAGASAVGKTSIAEDILKNNKEYVFIRSATTRKPRNDAYRDEYIYLSKDEFLGLIQKGGFLEFMEYGGEFYGTPLCEIETAFQKGKIPLLILDINGVRSLKEKTLDFSVFAVYIYDNIDVIESRLYKRELGENATFPEEKLLSFEARKSANRRDFKSLSQIYTLFDAFVKNEKISSSAEKINRIFSENKIMETEEIRLIAEALSREV